jgi:hypothetical protein
MSLLYRTSNLREPIRLSADYIPELVYYRGRVLTQGINGIRLNCDKEKEACDGGDILKVIMWVNRSNVVSKRRKS